MQFKPSIHEYTPKFYSDHIIQVQRNSDGKDHFIARQKDKGTGLAYWMKKAWRWMTQWNTHIDRIRERWIAQIENNLSGYSTSELLLHKKNLEKFQFNVIKKHNESAWSKLFFWTKVGNVPKSTYKKIDQKMKKLVNEGNKTPTVDKRKKEEREIQLQHIEGAGKLKNTHEVSQQVKNLLQKYDDMPKPTTPEEEGIQKKAKKELLETAFEHLKEALSSCEATPPQDIISLTADIFTRYGKLVYEEKYSYCMGMTRASLSLQLFNLGILENLDFSVTEIPSLDVFKDKALEHGNFPAIDDTLLDDELTDQVLKRVQYIALTSEELYLLAHTLSQFGFSCCHTVGYKDVSSVNVQRFENVYGLAKKLYELRAKEEEKFRLELAELLYNGFRGLEFKKGNGLEAAHKHLDEAAVLNPSLQMRARVANLKACDWHEVNPLKSLELVKEALLIREQIPVSDQNPFLLANARNNYASLVLKLTVDLEEAEKYLLPALEYAEARRGPRDEKGRVIDPSNEHQYFGLYDANMAKVRFNQDRLDEALVHIDRAIETFERRDDSTDELVKALVYKTEIEKAIQKQEESADISGK